MDRSISKHNKIFIIFILTFIILYTIILILTSGFRIFKSEILRNKPKKYMRTNWSSVEFGRIPVDCEIKVVLILCSEEMGVKNPAIDFERQFNQSIVLIKSILISLGKSKNCVKVILISNDQSHFHRMNEEILGGDWDVKFTSRLKLTFVALEYPPGTSWMRRLFRPCATLRLFLPDLLLHHDSVLYLDTDIIFLRSIEKLWRGLKAYNESILASMAPCLFHYGSSRNSVPYYGSSGLNAGIMLMNLTKMRNTKWSQKIRSIATQYRSKIKLADQDILNIYFYNFPEELQLISCDWNFRPFQCREGSYCEDGAMKNGISAIHGNAISFTTLGPEPLFQIIYTAFHNAQLTTNFNLGDLVKNLEIELQIKQENIQSPCAKYPAFNILVLNPLEKILRSGL